MDSLPKLDVVDWQDSPRHIIPKSRAPHPFLSPTLIGVAGTLLLHALLIQSLLFGSRGPKVKPPEAQESGDTLAKSKGDPSESLVLIALSAPAKLAQTATQNLVASLPDLSKIKIKSRVKVDPPVFLNIETLALSENDQASKPASDSGAGAEKARLFGIYTGQIQARIDRVWRRPRTPITEEKTSAPTTHDGESFQCEAQIVQDAMGNVREIMLPRCNGSSAWRDSLVSAIRQASPLPAPPSASVFSQSIILNFIGLNFIAGDAEDDYEPAPRTLVGAQ